MADARVVARVATSGRSAHWSASRRVEVVRHASSRLPFSLDRGWDRGCAMGRGAELLMVRVARAGSSIARIVLKRMSASHSPRLSLSPRPSLSPRRRLEGCLSNGNDEREPSSASITTEKVLKKM